MRDENIYTNYCLLGTVGYCPICSKPLPSTGRGGHADCEAELRRLKRRQAARHSGEEPNEVRDRFRCLRDDVAALMSYSSREICEVAGQEGEDFLIDIHLRLGGIRCL